jgi:hypothetical protein
MVLVAADGFVQRSFFPALSPLSQRSITNIRIMNNNKYQRMSSIFLSDKEEDNKNDSSSNSVLNNQDRLRQLGYSDDEIRRSQTSSIKNPKEIKVRVDLIDDVDPVSLTAIGFALIALNFLVFANLGDGGISGVVATIINSF